MADRTYALDNKEIQEFWQGIASKYRAHKSYFGTDDFGEDIIPEAFFDAIEAGEDVTQETWTYTVHSIEYERDSLELAVALMMVEATNQVPSVAGGGSSDTRDEEPGAHEATCSCPIEGSPKSCYISVENPAVTANSSYPQPGSHSYGDYITVNWNLSWVTLPTTYELETLKAELKIYRYLGSASGSSTTWKLDDCGGDIFLLYNVCRNVPFCNPDDCVIPLTEAQGIYPTFVGVYGITYGNCGTVDSNGFSWITAWFKAKDTIPTGEKYPIQGYDFEDAYALYQLLNP